MTPDFSQAGRASRLRTLLQLSGFDQKICRDQWNWNRNTFKSHLNGSAPFGFEKAYEYASAFGSDAVWLYSGIRMPDRFSAVESVIADRLTGADPSSSYVAALAAKGLPKVAQKVGEEAVETVIAALAQDDAALVGEAADLLFHLTLLLKLRGLSLTDIATELDRRHGRSGLAEKAGRIQD